MQHIRLLLLGLLLVGCAQTDNNNNDRDGFVRDETVRITEPTNGDSVGAAVIVAFEAGGAVGRIEVAVDGSVVAEADPDEQTEVALSLEEGRHDIAVVGYGNGKQLSSHEISVRVLDSDIGFNPWVTIMSPADGATVSNPAVFTFRYSGVDEIEVLADDWSLGTAPAGELIAYTFAGTDYPRSIEARGYSEGELVATDAITLTIRGEAPVVEGDLNDIVTELHEAYPTDGTHGYYWPTDTDWSGTTKDVWYQDTLVAEGDPYGRCFCVGLTWEVYMDAFQIADLQTGGDGSLNGLTVEDLYEFRTDWFVRDLLGEGPSEAFEIYGLGQQIYDIDEIKTGDFIQFWRNSGSGHNAIFIDWVLDMDDEIIGIRYWSTQGSTDGIGYNEEYFGSGSFDVDPNLFYVGRAWGPQDWLPWH